MYFWRSEPNELLPDHPLPRVNSNAHDLLADGRPRHEPLQLHGYVDSEWAACPRTRRSFGGEVLRLAG